MKQLLLATTKNFRYRELLVKGGYMVTEYNLPVTESLMREIQDLPSCAICIAEVTEEIIASNGPLFGLLRHKGRVLCLVENMNAGVKKFLLDQGMPEVLDPVRHDRLTSYINIMREKTSGDAGSMIILDDNGSARGILSTIIERFNYTPVFVDSVEELLGSISHSGVRFVLVNLNARFLDLNGLVRKFYSAKHNAAIPVLVYKDMREGLFVHELVSGLNRMTRFILSMDEVFSFMVDMLYKKDIIQHIANLKNLSDYNSLAGYGNEALNQIFFLHEKDIFDQANILDEKNYEGMVRVSRDIQRSILRVQGLKWLRLPSEKKDVSTAGRGG